jgi:hypothetical protein
VNRWMKWSSPALPVAVVLALVVAACGQATNSEGNGQGSTIRNVARAPATLAQADFCVDAESSSCEPTGAHGPLAVSFVTGHSGFECKECHYVGGRLAFKPASKGGLAFRPAPNPPPTFDAGAKTCSNIACHGVPAGQYSYYFPGNEDNDGDGYPDPELKTVNYGGTVAATTPSWYATGASCTACHGNPPANGSDGSNTWHSGNHANSQNVGPTGPNECELCHNLPTNVNSPIVRSVNGAGTVVLQPTFHATGAVNVNARFRSQCFGCH